MSDKKKNVVLDPEEVRNLEATCPEIVRFLRKLTEAPSGPEAEIAQTHMRDYIRAERVIYESIEGKAPPQMIAMCLAEVTNKPYRDSVLRYASFPESASEVRKYIQEYFSKKGCVFTFA